MRNKNGKEWCLLRIKVQRNEILGWYGDTKIACDKLQKTFMEMKAK